MKPIIAFCALFLVRAIALDARAGEVETALKQRYDFNFKEVELRHVFEYLGEYYEIKLDTSAVAAPDLKKEINYIGKGDKLRDGLDAMLRPHKIGFRAEKDRLIFGPLSEDKP